MNNLDESSTFGSISLIQLSLKVSIIVIVICGVANTYVMGILWYKRGFHASYTVFGLLALVIVAVGLYNWPSKKD